MLLQIAHTDNNSKAVNWKKTCQNKCQTIIRCSDKTRTYNNANKTRTGRSKLVLMLVWFRMSESRIRARSELSLASKTRLPNDFRKEWLLINLGSFVILYFTAIRFNCWLTYWIVIALVCQRFRNISPSWSVIFWVMKMRLTICLSCGLTVIFRLFWVFFRAFCGEYAKDRRLWHQILWIVCRCRLIIRPGVLWQLRCLR